MDEAQRVRGVIGRAGRQARCRDRLSSNSTRGTPYTVRLLRRKHPSESSAPMPLGDVIAAPRSTAGSEADWTEFDAWLQQLDVPQPTPLAAVASLSHDARSSRRRNNVPEVCRRQAGSRYLYLRIGTSVDWLTLPCPPQHRALCRWLCPYRVDSIHNCRRVCLTTWCRCWRRL